MESTFNGENEGDWGAVKYADFGLVLEFDSKSSRPSSDDFDPLHTMLLPFIFDAPV